MSATPRSRKGRPFASPSHGKVSFHTLYRSQPSNRSLFRIQFYPEPVSNAAKKGRRLRGSGSTEQDTTYCVAVRTHTRCMDHKLRLVLSVSSVQVGPGRHRQVVSWDSRFSGFFVIHYWSLGVAGRGIGLPPRLCSYSLRVATAHGVEA